MNSHIIRQLKLQFFNSVGVYYNDLISNNNITSCFAFLGRYLKTELGEFSCNEALLHTEEKGNLDFLAKTSNLIIRKVNFKEEKTKQKTPVLAKKANGEFIVILKTTNKYYLVFDTKKGLIKENMPLDLVDVYEVYKKTEFTKKGGGMNVWTLFFKIENIKSFFSKLITLSILIEIINLLLPIGTQLIMDNVVISKDSNLLVVICLGLAAFVIFKTIASLIRSWISIVMTSLLDIQWKSSFFWHLINLPLSFFNDKKLGDIRDRFDSLNFIKETYSEVLIRGVIDLIMIISLTIMMLFYGGWLVAVVLGFSFFYALLRVLTYDKYQNLEKEKIITNAQSNSHIMETLYSLLTIKSLSMEQIRNDRWLNLLVKNNNAEINIDKFNMLFLEVNSLIVSVEQVIILFLSASMVISHDMSIGMFIAFNSYRGVFADRFSNIVDIMLRFKIVDLHGRRIAEVALQEKDFHASNEFCYSDINSHPQIELKKVCYSFNEKENVLNNVSLKINYGENITIVGDSGVGKSTLLKIMAGLIQPTKGDVFVNGVSIYSSGLKDYRKIIACVLQEDKLLSGTVIDNITCFDEHADMSFVISCTKRCNIHEFITGLPKGYLTEISELGNSLSGGQKQRIMIARALYKKPRILFLDEATSHLDDENEKIINISISELNITRVVIAHRQSTIKFANRIFRL